MISLSTSEFSCCSLGGIGFALIYYKVFLKKKEGKMEEAEERNSTMANQPNLSERRIHIHTDNSLTFDREVMTLDPWTCDPVHQLNSRTDKNDDHFWNSNCYTEDHRGIRQNPTRWNNRTNTQLETDEEIERRRVRRMITEHDLRRFAIQQGILEYTNRLSHSRTSSHPGKEAVVRRVEAMINNREEEYGHKAQGGGCSKRNQALYCNSCRRTYRPSEPNLTKGRVHTLKIKDHGDFPFQNREIDRGVNIGNTSDTSKHIRIRRKSRTVMFNLEGMRHSKQRNSQSEDERTSRDEERAGKHNSKVQLRRLKGKLNLNPRGKRKVHPKRRNEQGHSARSSSKKSKRVTGTHTEKQEKTKERHQKRKKAAKVKGLVEDGEEHKEENSRQLGQKSKKTSAVGPGAPESTADDQCAEEQPETAQSVDNTNTVDQLPSDSQQPQDGCIQHHNTPPYLPTSVDNSTSLQAGSVFPNTMATGASSVFAGWITNSVSPSTAISTSSVAPNGAPGTFNGQEHLLPSASVLPANILQSPSVHTSPLLANQSEDFFMSTANSTVLQQSLPPSSGSSPFVEKLQSDPALEPGKDQLPSEVPQNRENMLPKQESWRAPAVRQSVEMENGDGPDLAETFPLGGLGGSMQTGEGPLLSDQSNTMSMQSVASADTNGQAAVVLQQEEYLSEEGGSKRKLRLVLPEKTSSRPLTALERKVR